MPTIQELNDAFRSGKRPDLGTIVITEGVRELTAVFGPLGVTTVHTKVANFDSFTEDNDPHKEHDFGSFEHLGEKIFWKIDYYDPDLLSGSEDPANEMSTHRVLTIMLASEY